MKYQGIHVLVTGADGFIGSHLTEQLVQAGADVRALSQYNAWNDWGWLEDTACLNQVEVVCGDVRDGSFVRTIVKDIDIIFNLAALIAIPYSYIAPASYVETNIGGALNICQAALERNVERVIQISTSEVYGTAKYIPIDEGHPLQPQSPYSASKIGADAVAMSFYHSFRLPVTVARPFNTYGPRQSARAVIPTVITQIASGKKQILLGDCSPTRDFNFVLDTCKGMLQLGLCADAVGETVNIGSGYEISIFDMVRLITKIMCSDVEIIRDKKRLRPESSEVFRLKCCPDKIRRLTGYQPDFTLEQGLEKTISWFQNKNHLEKYKANLYNI